MSNSSNSVEGFFQVFVTTLGPILIAEQDRELVLIHFLDETKPGILQSLTKGFTKSESLPLSNAKTQIEEYFKGYRTRFELAFKVGGTSFQKKAWSTLEDIRYGETWSYQKQAQRMGNPTAVRAVGQANGRNPLPIIIPCHRVVGKNGSLTGYGSGIQRKEWLLKMEYLFSRGQTR